MTFHRADSVLREQADQALFDRIAARYLKKDVVPSSSLARRSQLVAALRPILDERPTLGTVVDVGCGVGAPAAYLAGLYEHYVGIDQSEEMIKIAREFHRNNPQAAFLANNARAIDLPSSTADTVLCIGALHHITALDEVMASLVRIARPAAFLLAVEPQSANPLLQLMRRVRGRVDRAYSREQIYFTEHELTHLLGRHGLAILSVQHQGFLTPPFAQVILNPQLIFAPLSRAASRVDPWLAARLPRPLRKLSFNLAVIGRFAG